MVLIKPKNPRSDIIRGCILVAAVVAVLLVAADVAFISDGLLTAPFVVLFNVVCLAVAVLGIALTVGGLRQFVATGSYEAHQGLAEANSILAEELASRNAWDEESRLVEQATEAAAALDIDTLQLRQALHTMSHVANTFRLNYPMANSEANEVRTQYAAFVRKTLQQTVTVFNRDGLQAEAERIYRTMRQVLLQHLQKP